MPSRAPFLAISSRQRITLRSDVLNTRSLVSNSMQEAVDGVEYGVRVVLRRCYVGVTSVLRRCYVGVTSVLRRCYVGVTSVLRRCYVGVTSALRRCYVGVTSVLRRCYVGVKFESVLIRFFNKSYSTIYISIKIGDLKKCIRHIFK